MSRGRGYLHRGQYRKQFARPTICHLIWTGIALIKSIDPSGERPFPAGLDQRAHDLSGALHHRLHRAITAIAHPSADARSERLSFDKGAEADALHAASNEKVLRPPVRHGHELRRTAARRTSTLSAHRGLEPVDLAFVVARRRIFLILVVDRMLIDAAVGARR